MANIRAAYAEAQSALLTDGDNATMPKAVALKQTVNDWANDPQFQQNLGITVVGTPHAGGTATFTYTAPTGGTAATAANLTLTYSE